MGPAPRRRSPLSAGSLLDAVLTLHVPESATVASRALVASLGLLGVAPKTARQAIWRLTEDGLLRAERHGRNTTVARTDVGIAERQAAEDRIERFRADHDARLRGQQRPVVWVILTLPESTAVDERQRVRRALRALGWGALAPGAWLNVGDHSLDGARRLIDRFGLAATLATADLVAPTDVAAVIARLWDLPALGARYRDFVDEHADAVAGDAATCFTKRTTMVAAWSAFDDDPVLPASLLPDAWPGAVAQRVIADRYAEWRSGADRWWATAVRESSTEIVRTLRSV